MIRPINRCLNPQLLNLCQQAIKLGELNDKIKNNLDSSLSEHCQVAAFNHGCLVISVENAAWATELRYRLPELRDKLRKAGLYQLTSIKIELVCFDPQHTRAKTLVKTSKLSENARRIIRMIGKRCTYQPLKEALYHLANSNNEKD